MYNCITLLHSRNQHNIVNQLYVNKKIKQRVNNTASVKIIKRIFY